MKTWLIILIVFLVIIAIVGIVVLLLSLKKKKDIKAMKKNLATLTKDFGSCKETTKYADCVVDKLIDTFGYTTVKGLNNKGWDITSFFKKKSDQNKANNILHKCYASYC